MFDIHAWERTQSLLLVLLLAMQLFNSHDITCAYLNTHPPTQHQTKPGHGDTVAVHPFGETIIQMHLKCNLINAFPPDRDRAARNM